MVKNRKLKLLAGGITVLAASLFISAKASATDFPYNMQNGDLVITNTCGENCHHKISGVCSTNASTITVESGTHVITLSNVKLIVDSDAKSAFSIKPGAKVILRLEGTNILESGKGSAGILVPKGASLTINGGDASGELTVKAGHGQAAGIGGEGDTGDSAAAGDITILGGVVNATGSRSGAGIGGSYKGGAGNIVISGGKVTATGGDEKGVGIGSGGEGGADGKITINTSSNAGTEVTAQGGGGGVGMGSNTRNPGVDVTVEGGAVTAKGGEKLNDSGSYEAGILCKILSSDNSKNVVVNADNVDAADIGRFSGIIWNLAKTKCYVYGETELPESMTEIATNQAMYLMDGSSLFIPSSHSGLTLDGIISDYAGEGKGTGTIINANKIKIGDGTNYIPSERRKVELQPVDITIDETRLVYNGKNLADTAITINATRPIGTESYEVDRSKWVRYIDGKPENKMIDVGDYEVVYKREGYTPVPAKQNEESGENELITVMPRNLSDVTVEPLAAKKYDGKNTAPDLKLTYNGMTLQESTKDVKKDYKVTYKNNADDSIFDAGEFPTAVGEYTVIIEGEYDEDIKKGNYTGTVEVPYTIEKAPITEDMVKVEYDKD